MPWATGISEYGEDYTSWNLGSPGTIITAATTTPWGKGAHVFLKLVNNKTKLKEKKKGSKKNTYMCIYIYIKQTKPSSSSTLFYSRLNTFDMTKIAFIRFDLYTYAQSSNCSLLKNFAYGKTVRIHAHSITIARGDLGSDNGNILKIALTVL